MKTDYKFFWKGILSNFARTPYTSGDGINFSCSEQEFMYRKAIFFGDKEIAGQILDTSDPREIKKLGRAVRGYDDFLWGKVREGFMYKACLSKFTQHKAAREELLRYPGKTFVEASPYDTIWGIGLPEDDPRAWNQETWRGQNLLGKILGKIRDKISPSENPRNPYICKE